VVGWFLVQKYVVGYKFESKTHEYVIMIYIGVVTIQRLFEIVKTMFQAKTEQAKNDIPDFIYSFIYQIFRLVVVLLGYAALALAFSNLIAGLIMIPVYYFLFKTYKIGPFDKQLAISYFKISIPLVIILVAHTIMEQSDKVLLQYLSNSENVGYYTAGFRIGGFVKLISVVVGALFFPLFTKAIANNDIDYINDKIKKFESFMLSFIFPAVLFAAIFSDVIVKILLGTKYLPTIPILSIITLSMFFETLWQPYGNTLMAKGKFYLVAIIYVVQILIYIGLSFLALSPDLLNMGGFGLACAVFLSIIFVTVMFIVFSKKHIENLKLLPAIKMYIFSITYGILAYLFYQNFTNMSIEKLVFAIIFVPLYFGLAYMLKLIHKEEWRMVYSLLNFKKMSDYVKGEFKQKEK
jgi:O-antigen/teichoic acid export membrane protein